MATRNNQHYSILVLIASDVTHVLVINLRINVRTYQLLRIPFDKSYILSIYDKSKMTVGPMGRRTNGSWD